MKKLVAVAAIAASLALMGASAASAQLLDVGAGDLTVGVFPEEEFSVLSSSSHQFAVGGGMASFNTKFAFAAHNEPKGPSGYAVVSTASGVPNPPVVEAQGHVVCYVPSGAGPAATFSIEIEKASSGFPLPLDQAPYLTFVVLDFSATASGFPDFLTISQDLVPCAPVAGHLFFAFGAVTQGNIIVGNF